MSKRPPPTPKNALSPPRATNLTDPQTPPIVWHLWVQQDLKWGGGGGGLDLRLGGGADPLLSKSRFFFGGGGLRGRLLGLCGRDKWASGSLGEKRGGGREVRRGQPPPPICRIRGRGFTTLLPPPPYHCLSPLIQLITGAPLAPQIPPQSPLLELHCPPLEPHYLPQPPHWSPLTPPTPPIGAPLPPIRTP